MLAVLQEIPKSKTEWDRWSWHHKDSHTRIRQAIQKQKSINLPEYQLDPINLEDIDIFLVHNQETHNEMNAALSLQGSDLEGIDFNDEAKRAEWFWTHYQEHRDAENSLGI